MATEDVLVDTLVVEGRTVRCRIVPSAENAPSGLREPAPNLRLPLLLIHGLGCTGEAWDPTLQCFARQGADQPVIAPDLPGYGRSPGPAHALGIEEMADWTTRLLDTLRIARAHVAGNSMGCQVALALAHRHPQRVGSLVLVGPTTGTRFIPPWRYVTGLLLDAVREPILYNTTLLRMYWQMGTRRYLATTRKMLADDVFARAGAVTAPCLIVRGQHDAIVPEAIARRLAETLPRGEFAQVAGVAHAVQYNRPDAFTALAREFLIRAEAPSVSSPGQDISPLVMNVRTLPHVYGRSEKRKGVYHENS